MLPGDHPDDVPPVADTIEVPVAPPTPKRRPDGTFATAPPKKKRPVPAKQKAPVRPEAHEGMTSPVMPSTVEQLALQRILRRGLVLTTLLAHDGVSDRFAQAHADFLQTVSELLDDITEAAANALNGADGRRS